MFDTMTFTKVLGALCGSLLVFLLGAWAAEELYRTGGGKDQTQAYVIDTGDAGASAEVVEEAVRHYRLQLRSGAGAAARAKG